MAINFEYIYGSTPLDIDEAEGLLEGHINTKQQLDEWETMNIHK